MKETILFILLLFVIEIGFAQDSTVEVNKKNRLLNSDSTTKNTDMITNRPGATESSKAVYKDGFQIEMGLEYGRVANEPGSKDLKEYLFIPNIGVQYGVSNNVELRIFTTNYAIRSKINSGPTQFVYELANVIVGAKINLTNANGLLPEMAFLIDQGISTRPVYERSQWPTRGLLAWSYSLPSNFSLSGNFGYINEKEYFDQYITIGHSLSYSLNFGYGIKDNLGIFAEIYGQEQWNTGNGFPMILDGGMWYRITNKLQVDVSSGVNVNQHHYYVNAGISWLFLK